MAWSEFRRRRTERARKPKREAKKVQRTYGSTATVAAILEENPDEKEEDPDEKEEGPDGEGGDPDEEMREWVQLVMLGFLLVLVLVLELWEEREIGGR